MRTAVLFLAVSFLVRPAYGVEIQVPTPELGPCVLAMPDFIEQGRVWRTYACQVKAGVPSGVIGAIVTFPVSEAPEPEPEPVPEVEARNR